MSRADIEILRQASVEDAFFLDQQLINALQELQVNNLEQLSTLPLDCLTGTRGVGVARIEGVARMLKVVGVKRADLDDFLKGEKKQIGPDDELLARYVAVGTKLSSNLYIHELREPSRTYEAERYLNWVKDRRLTKWRKLLLELSAERKRDRRVSMALNSIGGQIEDYSRDDRYLNLRELRTMTPDALTQMAERSNWRGIHIPQAELMLKIFTPVKQVD